MKEIIINYIWNWFEKLFDSLKYNTLRKIFIIFISPLLIYTFAKALIDLGWFATIGYVVACIYGFSKILEDPNRIIKWGVGYAIGSSITPLIFSLIWPQIKEGTYISIFSAIIMTYIFLKILLKVTELKNS